GRREPAMDDGVETVEAETIGEDSGAEFSAGNAAIRGGQRLSEFVEDFVGGRLALLDEPVSQGVGVQDSKAHFARHGCHGAVAAGDPAGESESEHFIPITAPWRSVELRKIWVTRGGGARLSPYCS